MPATQIYRIGSWELGVLRKKAEFIKPYASNIRVNHFYALYYCVSGTISFQICRTFYTMHPGDLLLISSGEPSVITAQPGDRYDMIRLTFERDWLESMKMKSLLFPFESRRHGEENLLHPADFADEYWLRTVERLVTPFGPDELEAKSCTISLLYCILKQFRSRNRPPETGATLPKQILDYVNASFLRELDISDITERFHISRASLYRIFKKETGLPIGEYVTEKRLLAAREMLISGVSPKKASVYCLFNDYSTFYRAYKHQFGIAPSRQKKNAATALPDEKS